MPIALWNDRFATGIDIIDRQHQQLFAAVNQLQEAMASGQTATQIPKALEFMIRHTVDHFQTEEDYMHRHGYPAITEHFEAHAELLDRVSALKARFDEGDLVTEGISSFLADWLSHHIEDQDMAYVRFVKGRTAK